MKMKEYSKTLHHSSVLEHSLQAVLISRYVHGPQQQITGMCTSTSTRKFTKHSTKKVSDSHSHSLQFIRQRTDFVRNKHIVKKTFSLQLKQSCQAISGQDCSFYVYISLSLSDFVYKLCIFAQSERSKPFFCHIQNFIIFFSGKILIKIINGA